VLLAFYYQLQDPYHFKSLENLKDIFSFDLVIKDNAGNPSTTSQRLHLTNYLTFHALLTLDANPRFLQYLTTKDQEASSSSTKKQQQIREYTSKLKHFIFDEQQVQKNERVYKQRIVLLISMLHGIVKAIGKVVVSKESYQSEVPSLMNANRQHEMLHFTKRQHERIEADETLMKELGWLLPKIKEIWHSILSFEVIFNKIERLKLDLKFLISLESQGYKVLKYYKYLSNPSKSYTSTLSRKTSNSNL
jgi:hypothetical protein